MDKRCVDIDDVLNLFGVEDEDLYATGTIEDALYDGTLKIYELPSAERRGRWIKDKNLYKCTACNDLLCVAGWADCIPEKQIYTAFKYCPNCGARMYLNKNE